MSSRRKGIYKPNNITKKNMRNKKEILREEEIAMEKVWYDRYVSIFLKEYSEEKDPELKKVMKGAFKTIKELHKKYGKKNLGPLTEFGSGMINGRLETLRWVLGGDWDQLDV